MEKGGQTLNNITDICMIAYILPSIMIDAVGSRGKGMAVLICLFKDGLTEKLIHSYQQKGNESQKTLNR